MSLDEVDLELARWKTRVQLVSDSVMALRESAAYRRLRGEGGWPQVTFTGETEARTAPAFAAFQELWAHYALLTDLLDRATELRATVSWLMPSRAALDEIERLLTGASIKLPPTVTPLAKRGLLTAAEVAEAVTPQRLLDARARAFETARDAVVAVEAAWERTTATLATLDAETAALSDLAAALGEAPPSEVAAARRKADEWHALAGTDPIAAGSAADETTGLLRTARVRLEQAVQARDQVRAELATVRDSWRAVQEAHRRAVETAAERERKVIADGEYTPCSDESLFDALGPWLNRLDTALQKGGGRRFGSASRTGRAWPMRAGRATRQRSRPVPSCCASV